MHRLYTAQIYRSTIYFLYAIYLHQANNRKIIPYNLFTFKELHTKNKRCFKTAIYG